MNCHEAQNHLFADREGALEKGQRVALDAHVTTCADCRRIRDDLGAAFVTWRNETARTPLPDVEREWHAVRRKIRGGVEVGESARPRRRLIPWLAQPLAGAAALALTFYVAPSERRAGESIKSTPQVARADSVEVPGNASTLVYVDDKSGWLIVLASDAKQI